MLAQHREEFEALDWFHIARSQIIFLHNYAYNIYVNDSIVEAVILTLRCDREH